MDMGKGQSNWISPRILKNAICSNLNRKKDVEEMDKENYVRFFNK